jgi:hypothetical protein
VIGDAQGYGRADARKFFVMSMKRTVRVTGQNRRREVAGLNRSIVVPRRRRSEAP